MMDTEVSLAFLWYRKGCRMPLELTVFKYRDLDMVTIGHALCTDRLSPAHVWFHWHLVAPFFCHDTPCKRKAFVIYKRSL